MIKRVLLVGNPNCGKTTLFNALTKSNQKVGNWPGVTIEKKSGWLFESEKTIEIIDLPGVYALSLPEHENAKDAQITAKTLADNDFDLIVNLVDACHLERHLYLTSQLLELRKPLIVAVNMMDIAQKSGVHIDTSLLSQQLHCPVISLQAHRQIGIEPLSHSIRTQAITPPAHDPVHHYLSPNILQYLRKFQDEIPQYYPVTAGSTLYTAYRWLEQKPVPGPDFAEMAPIADIDVLLADARYQMVHHWVMAAQTKHNDGQEQFTAKLDRIFLHRFWGLPIFFALMYGVFFLAIGVGGAIQSGFDILSETLFMQAPAALMMHWQAPSWLIQLSAFGLGQALHTLVTFIPVLAVMYFLLAFLESSGYMARVAFIMDRFMRSLGLPGQAFVPMIIGFGCNVPAILSARTLHTERDRFLTVLMTPYMSCSARLAIYAVFVTAFFPNKGYQVIFSLYLLGIGMAILTGYFARRTLLVGEASPLILELPTYHCPSFFRLSKEAGVRLKYFLLRAGKVILPLCLVLSCFNCKFTPEFKVILSYLQQWIMPIFSPMGIDVDNWPAVMSLMTGMLAKEVVIGTLNNLYTQMDHVAQHWQTLWSIDLGQAVYQAALSIYEHLQILFGLSVEQVDTQTNTLPELLQHYFSSSISAYAYLLFILLYIPCVSTMAAIRQESSRRLMWFSILWSLGLAYSVAVIFYQIASRITMAEGPVVHQMGLGLLVLMAFGLGVWAFCKLGGRRALSNS